MFPSPHLHFPSFVTFLSLFLTFLDLQETVPKESVGSWFQNWMVLFTKEYFPMSVLCFLLLIFLSLAAETLFKVNKICTFPHLFHFHS
jgi:hypothetical protein